ncbi:GPP34 family phosphoprotein [Micromonospora sp. CCTCC AA 2012012]|uniref:GPP34 family phosphoprotein n=1 Tax=Micromonospora sp. CCTCC AA 2012012 TaxID=3111921 RepID=A0AAU8HLH5_9ACTN
MNTRLPVLPLRDELFLIGHDDDTGRPHLHRQALAAGLAGATLIDLFLTGRVRLDPTDTDLPAPEQRLYLHTHQPVGDLIADAALTTLRHTLGAPPLKTWLRGFTDDLYERTRAGLVTAGILRQHHHRRLGGLFRIDTWLITHTRWAVVPRARLCYLAAGREPPTNHTAALAGLVAVLGLTPHLYLDADTATLAARLRAVAARHHPTVQAITTAVDAAIGDLATATYR